MKILRRLLFGAAAFIAVAVFATWYMNRAFAGASLSRIAVTGAPPQVEAARKELRSAGPAGLAAFLVAWSDEIQLDGPPREELREALDAVCGQRDCWASRLFWFTDLERAKEYARQVGKPILSLRLLGRLDEDFSCANSRFFRTTLYPNAKVSNLLRNNFVLHWSSVGPVPRVRIEVGEGRVFERPLTGNSLHYVLDHEGTVLEALPGMYGPRAFAERLTRALDRHVELHPEAPPIRNDPPLLAAAEVIGRRFPPGLFDSVQRGKQKRTMSDLRSVATAIESYQVDHGLYPLAPDIAALGPYLETTYIKELPTRDGWKTAFVYTVSPDGQDYTIESWGKNRADDRDRIGSNQHFNNDIVYSAGTFVAYPEGSKTSSERRTIRRIAPKAPVRDNAPDNPAARAWLDEVAIPALGEETLDERARALIRAKLGLDARSNEEAALPHPVAMIKKFEETMTRDTAYNESFLRPRVLAHLRDHPDESLQALTHWIYTDVFEYPLDDPWRGLVEEDTWAALDGNGLRRR